MSPTIKAEIPRDSEQAQRCSVDFTARDVWIRFDPPLPEGPHKMTRVETMAAAALIGIAKALTGNGEAAIMAALQAFDGKQKRKATR